MEVELERIANTAHNASEIIRRVSGEPDSWRSAARIALAHITLAQYDLAKWMSERELVEQRETVARLLAGNPPGPIAATESFHRNSHAEALASTAPGQSDDLGLYRVFYWDTFEEPGQDTTQIGEADSLAGAEALVREKYGERIKPTGADHVDIVFRGTVVSRFNVG